MDDLMQTAKEAGIDFDLIDEDEGQIWYVTTEGLRLFAQLVAKKAVEAEREACAKVCDELGSKNPGFAFECAVAIRARTSD